MTYDFRRLQHDFKPLDGRWFGLVFALGLSVSVQAQTSIPLDNRIQLNAAQQAAYDKLMNRWRATPEGVQIVNSINQSSAQTVDRIGKYKEIGLSLGAQKQVEMAGRTAVTIPNTDIKVPVDTKIRLTTAAIGKTLAKAAVLYSAYELGSSLYDIWADVGLQINAQGEIQQPGTGGTSLVSQGYYFTFDSRKFYDPIAACNAFPASFKPYYPGWYTHSYDIGVANGVNSLGCRYGLSPGATTNLQYYQAGWRSYSGACPAGQFVVGTPTNPTCSLTDPNAPVTLTEQQIADKIAQQSGWPDSTILGALNQAVQLPGIGDELTQYLEDNPPPLQIAVPIEGQPVTTGTFDATKPRVTVTTQTNPDGTTTQTTQEEKVQATVEPTTNTIKFERIATTSEQLFSPTGVPIGTPQTRTTVTPEVPELAGDQAQSGEEEQQSKSVVESFCEKFPGIIGCSTWGNPEDITDEVPTRTQNLELQAENLGLGGGSCPAPFTWNDSLGTHSINLQQYCDVLETIVKPLVLAFALLAAIFIVAPIRDAS